VEGSHAGPFFRTQDHVHEIIPTTYRCFEFRFFDFSWEREHHLRFVTFDLPFSHFDGHGQYTHLGAYAVSSFSYPFVCMPV
jgi:hypothetical protein